MEIPKRLENAITKLYTAFHEGTLFSRKCNSCAVGNIVGHGDWFGSSSYIYIDLNEACISAINISRNNSGYSSIELAYVEYVFIKSIGLSDFEQEEGVEETKELQFKGLCSVVEYLCELDNVPNVMDYSRVFEFNEKNEPIHELSF